MFNLTTYPYLVALFRELDVDTGPLSGRPFWLLLFFSAQDRILLAAAFIFSPNHRVFGFLTRAHISRSRLPSLSASCLSVSFFDFPLSWRMCPRRRCCLPPFPAPRAVGDELQQLGGGLGVEQRRPHHHLPLPHTGPFTRPRAPQGEPLFLFLFMENGRSNYLKYLIRDQTSPNKVAVSPVVERSKKYRGTRRSKNNAGTETGWRRGGVGEGWAPPQQGRELASSLPFRFRVPPRTSAWVGRVPAASFFPRQQFFWPPGAGPHPGFRKSLPSSLASTVTTSPWCHRLAQFPFA